MLSIVKVPVKMDKSLGTFVTGDVEALGVPYGMLPRGPRSAKFWGWLSGRRPVLHCVATMGSNKST